jgi:hypothetical protein
MSVMNMGVFFRLAPVDSEGLQWLFTGDQLVDHYPRVKASLIHFLSLLQGPRALQIESFIPIYPLMVLYTRIVHPKPEFRSTSKSIIYTTLPIDSITNSSHSSQYKFKGSTNENIHLNLLTDSSLICIVHPHPEFKSTFKPIVHSNIPINSALTLKRSF